jgi:hypothetical protein
MTWSELLTLKLSPYWFANEVPQPPTLARWSRLSATGLLATRNDNFKWDRSIP